MKTVHLIDGDHMYHSKSEVGTIAGCHDNTKIVRLLTLLKIASFHYNAKKATNGTVAMAGCHDNTKIVQYHCWKLLVAMAMQTWCNCSHSKVDSCHDNTKIKESLPHLNITGRHANAKKVQLLAQLSYGCHDNKTKDGGSHSENYYMFSL